MAPPPFRLSFQPRVASAVIQAVVQTQTPAPRLISVNSSIKITPAGVMLKALEKILNSQPSDQQITDLLARLKTIATVPLQGENINLRIPQTVSTLFPGKALESLNDQQMVQCAQIVLTHLETSENTKPGGLSLELWAHILSFLSPKDLITCMQVWKQWKSLIVEFPETEKILYKQTFGCEPNPNKGVHRQMKAVAFNLTQHYLVEKCLFKRQFSELLLNTSFNVSGNHIVAVSPLVKTSITWDISKDEPEIDPKSFDSPETNFNSMIIPQNTQLIDKEQFVGITQNGQCVLVNLSNPTLSRVLFSLEKKDIKCIHVTENALALVYNDGNCEIRELNTGKMINEFHFGSDVTVVHLDVKGKRLLIGSADGKLQIWDLKSKIGEVNRCMRGAQIFNWSIKHICTQGNILAVCSSKGEIAIMPMHKLYCIKHIKTEDVHDMRFQGTRLLVLSGFFVELKLQEYDFSTSDEEFFTNYTVNTNGNTLMLPLERFLKLPQEDKVAILALYKKAQGITNNSTDDFKCIDNVDVLLKVAKEHFGKALPKK